MKKHIALAAAAGLVCAGAMIVSAPSASAEKMSLSASPGVDGNITVTVRLDESINATSYAAWVGFDPTQVDFVKAEPTGNVFSSANTYFFSEVTEAGNEVALLWVDGENNITETGKLAVVTFKPKATFTGNANITLEVADEVKSGEGKTVSFIVSTAGNEIKPTKAPSVWSGKLGDLNGDGIVNAKDASLLRQYVKNPSDVPEGTHLENGDITGDGNKNAKDASVIRQYVKGDADAKERID